jgi:hypothetical protein
MRHRPHYTLTREQQSLLGRLLEEADGAGLPNGLRELPQGLDVPDDGVPLSHFEPEDDEATGGVGVNANGFPNFGQRQAREHSTDMKVEMLHKWFPPKGGWNVSVADTLTHEQAFYFMDCISAVAKMIGAKGGAAVAGQTMIPTYRALHERLSRVLTRPDRSRDYAASGEGVRSRDKEDLKRTRQLAGLEEPHDGPGDYRHPVPPPVDEEPPLPLADGPGGFFARHDDEEDDGHGHLLGGEEDEEPEGDEEEYYQHRIPDPVGDQEALPLASGPAGKFFGKKKPVRVSTQRWREIAAHVEAVRRNLEQDDIYRTHLKTLTAKKAYFLRHLKQAMGVPDAGDLPVPQSRMAGLWNMAGLGRRQRGDTYEMQEWANDLRALVPDSRGAAWDGRPEAGHAKEWLLDMHRVPEDVARIMECWRGPKSKLTPQRVVGILCEEYFAAGRPVSEAGMERAVGAALEQLAADPGNPTEFESLFWWVSG